MIFALGADGRRKTCFTLFRTLKTKSLNPILEVPLHRLASSRSLVQYSEVKWTAGKTGRTISTGQAVIGTMVAGSRGRVGKVSEGTAHGAQVEIQVIAAVAGCTGQGRSASRTVGRTILTKIR